MSTNDVVLAFSGGLDTSFCIPYLQEHGYAVHTVFADTGGVDADERAFIEARAKAGLTQTQPARRMETTLSVTARMETGR